MLNFILYIYVAQFLIFWLLYLFDEGKRPPILKVRHLIPLFGLVIMIYDYLENI